MQEFDREAFARLCRQAAGSPTPEEAATLADKLLPFGELLAAKRSQALIQGKTPEEDETGFVQAASALCAALGADKNPSQVLALSTAATKLSPLSEQLYAYTLRALGALGMYKAIITEYHRMSRVFAEELEQPPSAEVTAMYKEAKAVINVKDEDTLVIGDELKTVLREGYDEEGPLFCTYDVLKYLFNMQSRASGRTGLKSIVLLLTLEGVGGGEISARMMAQAMQAVREGVLKHELRRSDTVAKYSAHQFVMMLSVSREETAASVKARIQTVCRPLLERYGLKLRFATITPQG